jgi:hypothetical protein
MVFERGFVRLAALASVLWLLPADSNSAFGLVALVEFSSGSFTAMPTAGTVLSSPTVMVTVDGYTFTGDSSVQVDASTASDVTVTLRGDLLFTISTPTVETINSFITVYAGSNYSGSSGAATLGPQQSSLQTELLPAVFLNGNYYYDMYDPVGGPSSPLALSATGTNYQGLPGYSASEVIGPFLVNPSDANRGFLKDTSFFDLHWTATLTFTNVIIDPNQGPETLNILLPGGAKMDPAAPEPSTLAMLAFGLFVTAGCRFGRISGGKRGQNVEVLSRRRAAMTDKTSLN